MVRRKLCALRRSVMGEGQNASLGVAEDDDKGVIVMGANCLIRMINDVRGLPCANAMASSPERSAKCPIFSNQ